jgi:iron complex transport system permease protein
MTRESSKDANGPTAHDWDHRPLRSRLMITVGGFGTLALAVAVLAPLVGSTPIDFARVFDRSIPFVDNADAQIFFLARLPRVLAAMVVGSALATSGVVLQAMFRNPLAAPETLGVSAGAALGAILAIVLGFTVTVGPFSPVPIASLAGALGAATAVYLLASAPRRPLSTAVLLLAGVTLNAFISALILFVQYLSDFTQSFRALRWMIGDLDVGNYVPILASLPLVVVAFAMAAMISAPLNLLTLGGDVAATRGVNVVRTHRLAFLTASLATSAAVSLAGPVAFIGIVVPHLVRLIVGVDNRVVLPAAALFGAAFLVGCDLVARTVMPATEIPVGIVTALVGGPFFLWLLVRKV